MERVEYNPQDARADEVSDTGGSRDPQDAADTRAEVCSRAPTQKRNRQIPKPNESGKIAFWTCRKCGQECRFTCDLADLDMKCDCETNPYKPISILPKECGGYYDLEPGAELKCKWGNLHPLTGPNRLKPPVRS